MKLKRSDILKIDDALKSLIEIRMTPDSAFAVASNIVLSEAAAGIIRSAYQPVAGFDKFSKEKTALLEKYGDAVGNGQFNIKPQNVKILNQEIESLVNKHNDVVDMQEKYDIAFNESLEKEHEVAFKEINNSDLTVEGIEPGKLIVLIQTGLLKNGSK